MSRMLLVETATPKRVRKKAEQILRDEGSEAPELTILCGEDAATSRYLAEVPGVQVVPLSKGNRRRILAELSRRNFDLLYLFWTGESKYRRMKLHALRIKARAIRVDIGDGSAFNLTWKACIRHWQFRHAHPLPVDHWEFVSTQAERALFAGEKVLLVQSAEPKYVLRALEQLKNTPLFLNPRYYLFCRNTPEIVKSFSGHPMIHEIRTHSEARGSWGHLRRLRKERFSAVVVFFTGDPSYWKIKYFAFLVGARQKIIFNEFNACFYFTLGHWLATLSHRMRGRPLPQFRSRRMFQAQIILFLMLKVFLIPFRFLWLLLIWAKLRTAALQSARQRRRNAENGL